jgi:nicotinamide mononucleotide transporter
MGVLIRLLDFETQATLFAVVYLVLAIRQNIWCWPAGLISVALWATVDVGAKLYMDFALQVFYFAMGIYGWIQWRRGGEAHTGVRVHWWPASAHLIAAGASLVIGLVFGFAMSHTDAQFPYLDSLTTVAAIVATFMVARKVMENWIYWFVIDAVYVYIYWQRGLDWFAGLYLVYLVMIVIGFRAWLNSLDSGPTGADERAAA